MKQYQPISIGFYIRRNRNIRKDYSVYCCIKIKNDKMKELLILNSINKDDWDARKGRPKQKKEELIKLSILLDAIKTKLLGIYLDLTVNDQELSAEKIKNIFLGNENPDVSILQLFDTAIKKYQKELAEGSLKNYNATKEYLTAFCKANFKSSDVPLKYLNYNFIDGFKTFILNNPLKPNDPCTNNSCMKHLERLKKIIKWAYETKQIDRNVFASFPIRKKHYESKILTLAQLKKLETKSLHQSMLSLVRDLFVFCCYTGMAPIDMQQLQSHQVYLGTSNITWVRYNRAKSKRQANVPLLESALAIVKRHEWNSGDIPRITLFPFVTNKDLNDNLKMISEICEIGFPLNFYIARHTFATTVTLLQGVPITSIKEMMGHDKIESTINYARTNFSVIANDMKLVEERMSA